MFISSNSIITSIVITRSQERSSSVIVIVTRRRNFSIITSSTFNSLGVKFMNAFEDSAHVRRGGAECADEHPETNDDNDVVEDCQGRVVGEQPELWDGDCLDGEKQGSFGEAGALVVRRGEDHEGDEGDSPEGGDAGLPVKGGGEEEDHGGLHGLGAVRLHVVVHGFDAHVAGVEGHGAEERNDHQQELAGSDVALGVVGGENGLDEASAVVVEGLGNVEESGENGSFSIEEVTEETEKRSRPTGEEGEPEVVLVVGAREDASRTSDTKDDGDEVDEESPSLDALAESSCGESVQVDTRVEHAADDHEESSDEDARVDDDELRVARVGCGAAVDDFARNDGEADIQRVGVVGAKTEEDPEGEEEESGVVVLETVERSGSRRGGGSGSGAGSGSSSGSRSTSASVFATPLDEGGDEQQDDGDAVHHGLQNGGLDELVGREGSLGAAVGGEVRSEEASNDGEEDEEHTAASDTDLVSGEVQVSDALASSINVVEEGFGSATGLLQVVPDEVASNDAAQESPAVGDEECLVQQQEGDCGEDEVEGIQLTGKECDDVGFCVDHVHADGGDGEEEALDEVTNVTIGDIKRELKSSRTGVVFSVDGIGHYNFTIFF